MADTHTWPQYQSHKVVRAVQIKSVQWDQHRIVPKDAKAFKVTDEWLYIHAPEAGGYILAYEDGYMSYSPASAFEDGYTRLPEKGKGSQSTPPSKPKKK